MISSPLPGIWLRERAAGVRGRPIFAGRSALPTTRYSTVWRFVCMAICCADMLVGGVGANRSAPAWRQAYRALQHTTARQRCAQPTIKRFPNDIQDFAIEFVAMQRKRESADYDPDGTFYKSDVLQDINTTENVIGQFMKAPLKDRRAFAVYILLNIRNN
jgi:hypothetical protein